MNCHHLIVRKAPRKFRIILNIARLDEIASLTENYYRTIGKTYIVSPKDSRLSAYSTVNMFSKFLLKFIKAIIFELKKRYLKTKIVL